MARSKTGTKRVALRFSGNSQQLRYKTEFEDGSADIINISASGCALEALTVPLVDDEKILILLSLEKNTTALEISARVVRIGEGFTAVRFISLAENDKQRLVKYFAKKQRRITEDSQ